MSDNVLRKVVGVERFMSSATGPDPVLRNSIISVPRELAEMPDVGLDAQFYVDGLGNKHPLFSAVLEDDAEAAPIEGTDGADEGGDPTQSQDEQQEKDTDSTPAEDATPTAARARRSRAKS